MISPGDNILIVGDSWGCGEWSVTGPYRVVHTGLEHFLSEYGCNVVNLSEGGASNQHALNVLRDTKNLENVDYVVWFQTDPTRDFTPHTQSPFLQSVAKLVEAGKKQLDKTYSELDNIGIKIYCLGGVAKLEKSINNYPNLVPVIPSIIEMFGGVQPEYWIGYWANIEMYPDVRLCDEFLTELEASPINSIEDWGEILPKQWFYPDGIHPNRDAHYKIFQHIINQHK